VAQFKWHCAAQVGEIQFCMVVSCSGRDLLLEVVIVVCFLLLIHRDILVVAIYNLIYPVEKKSQTKGPT